MLFESQNDFDFVMNNVLANNNLLVNDTVGLIRGNMFSNEYKPYKNLKPTSIEATTDKDKLLLKIYELDFAIIDLGLYLDLHPNDINVFNKYKNYIDNYNKLKKMYDEKYNPLCQTNVSDDNYNWINNPWPWDKDGGIKYV